MDMEYKLLVDDVVMWRGKKMPTQADIDRTAADANECGWNGTTLELFKDDQWIKTVTPSEGVLS